MKSYFVRTRNWYEVLIIALIVGAIVLSSIVAMSRARVERIPLSGIPSIDHGIYPDAHVEEVEDVVITAKKLDWSS